MFNLVEYATRPSVKTTMLKNHTSVCCDYGVLHHCKYLAELLLDVLLSVLRLQKMLAKRSSTALIGEVNTLPVSIETEEVCVVPLPLRVEFVCEMFWLVRTHL